MRVTQCNVVILAGMTDERFIIGRTSLKELRLVAKKNGEMRRRSTQQ